MKRIMAILIIAVMMISVCAIDFAHEIGTSGGYVWYDVRGSAGNQYCYVLTNNDYLDEPLLSHYSAALTHWNATSRSMFVDSSYSTSKLDMFTPATSSWIYGDGTAGITFLCNSSGQWNVNLPPSTGAGPFTNGTITYAAIWYNPSSDLFPEDPPYDPQQNYLLRHEMGHVLGLGHPGDSTISIMHRFIDLDSTFWYKVQSHDRRDLYEKYVY